MRSKNEQPPHGPPEKGGSESFCQVLDSPLAEEGFVVLLSAVLKFFTQEGTEVRHVGHRAPDVTKSP